MMKQLNVFNESIHGVVLNPITGYHRDGFCNYHTSDSGLHLVCALMTETFLSFSRSRGNDLSTPRPEFNFPGLRVTHGVYVLNDGWRHINTILLQKFICNKNSSRVIKNN